MRPSSIEEGPGALLRIPGLADQPGLLHAFSTLAMGSMRGPGPNRSPVTPEREAFARALGLDPARLTVAGAVHGADVVRVDEPAGVVPGCDGLMTDCPGVPLLATFADCYPVLLFDPGRRALAVVHAGWRGSAAGIAGRAVQALRREYGCRPEDLLAGLGPGICGDCYDVSEEVAARFDRGCGRPAADGRTLLDLAAVNRSQLVAAGVPAASVTAHGACTREHPDLASHRRSPDGTRFACIATIR